MHSFLFCPRFTAFTFFHWTVLVWADTVGCAYTAMISHHSCSSLPFTFGLDYVPFLSPRVRCSHYSFGHATLRTFCAFSFTAHTCHGFTCAHHFCLSSCSSSLDHGHLFTGSSCLIFLSPCLCAFSLFLYTVGHCILFPLDSNTAHYAWTAFLGCFYGFLCLVFPVFLGFMHSLWFSLVHSLSFRFSFVRPSCCLRYAHHYPILCPLVPTFIWIRCDVHVLS